jgi:hypothetical protein
MQIANGAKMKNRIIVLASVICMYANAATLYVANDGAHVPPFDSWAKAATDIQIAINSALPGDTIMISNGHYYANLVVNDKPLTIAGLGVDKTVIDGSRSNSVITISSADGVNLENITAIRGLAASGGGLAVYDSLLNCRDCNFVTNEAGFHGGGVYVSNSVVTIEGGIIGWNQITVQDGSGLSAHYSDLIVTNAQILKNIAGDSSIELRRGTVLFTDSRISGNESFQFGYTLHADQCALTVDSSQFILNQNTGGAIMRLNRCAASVVNSFISRNYALGIQVDGAGSGNMLNHCTLYANALGGVKSLVGTSGLSVINSILWNNGTEVSDADVSYSCVQDVVSGTGNISDDPQITLRGYLTASSPCINAGTNTGLTAYDIHNEFRVDTPDMGADEWVNSDADVLPDWWETEWGFSTSSPDNSEAISDNDGDTYTAEQEYNWGTRPLDRWSPESYVDSTSKETLEDGSPTYPYKKLGAALNDSTKAIISIAPGTYTELDGIQLQAGEFKLNGDSDNPPVVIVPENGNSILQAFALEKLEISSIKFRGREGFGQGRAVHIERGELVMNNCTVEKIRTFMNDGGGIYGENAEVAIDNCRLYENEGVQGGGLALVDCIGTVADCVMDDNTGRGFGGGIYLQDSPVEVLNCVVVNNEAFSEGGGIYVNGTSPDVQNCIVWDNSVIFGSYPQLFNVDVHYSCVQNGTLVNGNITNYPYLTPGFFLTHVSACIDSGTNNPGAGPDVNEEPRPINSITDIGMDEWLDSDNDYLPDWWEVKWNFPTNYPSGNDDTDIDGIPNVDEYRNGTLPVNTNNLSIIGATNLVARATKGLTNFVFVVTTTNGYNGITCTTSAAPGSDFTAVGITGIFSWVPTPTQVGTWSNVIFETSDNICSVSNIIAITVLQTNRAPVLASISSQTVGEGQLLSFDFSATDIDGDRLQMVCSNAMLSGSRIIYLSNGVSRFQWVPPFSAAGLYSNVFFGAYDTEFWDISHVLITVTNIVQPPTHPSVKINNDAGYTNSAEVTLNLFANNAAEMRVGDDPGSLGSWQPYDTSIPWTLVGTEGDNYVYTQFRAPWGDTSTTVVDSIQIDVTAPSCSALFPPNGWTTNGIPELSWTGDDTIGGAGVGHYELETNGSVFVVVADTFLCDITSQGSNTWQVRSVDRAGNPSPWTGLRWFYFDSAPPLNPSVTILDSRGNGWITGSNVTLELSAIDATPMQMRIGNQPDVSDGSWEQYTTGKSWTLPGGEGVNTVYVKYRDAAMQESSIASDTVGIDHGAPGITSLSPTQTWIWSNTPVDITWDAQDSLSGISGLWVEVNGSGMHTTESSCQPEWQLEQTNEWRVQAVDMAGNQSAWSVYGYVGYDTNPPVIAADVIVTPDDTAAWVWGGTGLVQWNTNAITDWAISDTPIGLELMLWSTFARIPLASNLVNSGETVVNLPMDTTNDWVLLILTATDRCGNTAEEFSEAFQILVPEPGSAVLLIAVCLGLLRAGYSRRR